MPPSVSEAGRVADALRAEILTGDLPDGSRLPSLTALASTYGVSVDIARQAIGILRAERLVATRHGAGAFVTRFALITRRSPGRLAAEQWGQGKAIQDHDTGPRPRTVDVVVTETSAPPYVAEALGIRAATKVLSRSRRFVVEDRPVQLATSYLPLALVRGTAITYTDTGPGGLYARLAEIGHAPVRFVERVVARAPYPVEREALEMQAGGSLVYEITRLAYDDTGRCVEVNRMILDAAAYQLEYGFPA
jgi:GntR family transcriptional regulator